MEEKHSHSRIKSKSTGVNQLPIIKNRTSLYDVESIKTQTKDFDLRTYQSGLPVYNALADRHSKIHFQLEKRRKEMRKLALARLSIKTLGCEPTQIDSEKELSREKFLSYLQSVRDKIKQNENNGT